MQAEGYSGSEASVQAYAVRWRKTHKHPATFLPLEFEPGQDGQVDWGEAQVILAGVQQTVQVFVLHLSYSRRTFVMAFPAQKQEAFLLGQVHAFAFFGGCPIGSATIISRRRSIPSSKGAFARNSGPLWPFAATTYLTPITALNSKPLCNIDLLNIV